MFLIVLSCALVATANAGYASSSSGAGLYNSNTYSGQNYGSKYPYSNQYTGYAGGSVNSGPYFPAPPFANPYEFQNAFQQYFNQLSSLNANLYNQQLAHQQAVFNSIRNQAYGGGGAYGGGAAYGGTGAGTFGGAGVGSYGSTGSYGGVGPSGNYGGSYGGPNYASAGGAVGNGYQQQHASIYPANPAHPNLDSRFGGDEGVGVVHSQGQPGFVGVSSFSSSSDVNGVKHRESATSVNNNGKVTTYHVRNP